MLRAELDHKIRAQQLKKRRGAQWRHAKGGNIRTVAESAELRYFRAVRRQLFASVIVDSRLDSVFRQHRAMNLDRRQG